MNNMKYFIEAVAIPMCFVLAFLIPGLIVYIKNRNKKDCESEFNDKLMRRGMVIALVFSLIVTILIFYFAYF